ncbi:MAG: hypothetical protein ACLRRT_14110 [Ruthenibacterium lactatiformans]
MPLCKPALVSVGLFNFIWTWNAFMDPLIYISSVKISALARAAHDAGPWFRSRLERDIRHVGAVHPAAGAVVLCGQKYFIQGISTSGLKG